MCLALFRSRAAVLATLPSLSHVIRRPALSGLLVHSARTGAVGRWPPPGGLALGGP